MVAWKRRVKKEKDNAETQSAQRKRGGNEEGFGACLELRFSWAGWQPELPAEVARLGGEDGGAPNPDIRRTDFSGCLPGRGDAWRLLEIWRRRRSVPGRGPFC